VVSGIVVGIIALPLAIALSVAVGASPVSGLYTAAFAGAVAAIFGGSRFNVTGPTAALVPLLVSVVVRFGPGALPMVGLMAGIILVAMSAFKLGRLMKYMPGLVVIGFTAGIGLSIAFGQLNSLLGVAGTDPTLEHFHERLWDMLRHLGTIGPATPIIGAASIAVLIAWPRLAARSRRLKYIPAALVAVVAMTLIVWLFDLNTLTVSGKYGALPHSLPRPSFAFFDLSLVGPLLPSAIAVAILAGVESLLSAVMADNLARSDERHKPDRELFGQGLGNLVAPLFGGVPSTAAIARTGAGIQNGATSRLSAIVHAVFVFGAAIAFAGLVGLIPLAVLAAVLVMVAWRITEVPELVRMAKSAPKQDHAVLFATMIITVTVDLTYAILAGVVLSMVLLLRQLTSEEPAQALAPDATGQIRQVSNGLSELMKSRPDILFFNAQGLISFHSAYKFERRLLECDARPLIIRMKDVHYMDTTGMMTLESIIEKRHAIGGRVMLTAIQPHVRPRVERFGLLRMAGPENVFERTIDAIASVLVPAADVAATPSATLNQDVAASPIIPGFPIDQSRPSPAV
jgi:SulP family sulfate permease